MKAAWRDAAAWLPLAVAAVFFGGRELACGAGPGATQTASSVELPVPLGAEAPRHEQSYELDATHTSVRFAVAGPGGEVLLACPAVRGQLELRPDGAASELVLELDLGSLEPVAAQDAHWAAAAIRHLLGAHRASTLTYRATLVSRATTPLPQLTRVHWLGRMRFGNHTVQQPIDLWQTAMPGRPLRLQGYGTVGADVYGLLRRSWLGLVQEKHVVTLGLDLAWKRRPAH